MIRASAPRRSDPSRTALLPCAAACVAMLLTACQPGAEAELRQQVARQASELEQKSNQLAACEATVKELRARVLRAQGFDPKRLEKLCYPTDLRLARLTGGYDADGQPGDEGVMVYLQPLDRVGDVVKAAGEIRIQLFDLAAPEGEQLVGEYLFDVDETAKLWYGKLMTQHFTLKCPWKTRRPAHGDLTVRATFVDYFTTNVLSTQGVCAVALR
ncbi:MAG: hypothetical protein CHACPFDD_00577 [Phycisphaerae bacterium]|nr:hypothetical protein [Phycisphaerae bacterium]